MRLGLNAKKTKVMPVTKRHWSYQQVTTGSSVNIWRWTYVCYCRSAMTQKFILTGPGTFRRAERVEATDGLYQTSCDSLFHSEMVLGKNEYL